MTKLNLCFALSRLEHRRALGWGRGTRAVRQVVARGHIGQFRAPCSSDGGRFLPVARPVAGLQAGTPFAISCSHRPGNRRKSSSNRRTRSPELTFEPSCKDLLHRPGAPAPTQCTAAFKPRECKTQIKFRHNCVKDTTFWPVQWLGCVVIRGLASLDCLARAPQRHADTGRTLMRKRHCPRFAT